MKVSKPRRQLYRGSLLALACLLLLPTFAFAQLPTPTYGWNLGNTLEPPGGEGTWGPAATQNVINAVADAGFNVIRIPVAWDSHANQSTLQIDPAWMARVKQVVDWCYANDLHVIINCHWDGGWLENHITDTVDPTINAKMQSYWTQIATAFAGYDDHLLFAGANEPNADTAAEWATLRTYEQTFVNAVRATGGNNTTRWLVIQGPNTDIDLTDKLVTSLPDDSTPGRLVFEVHYYSPWNYVGMNKDETWGNQYFYWGNGYHSTTDTAHNATSGEESYVDAQLDKMTSKFVNRGIPVIIGEFGCAKRSPQLTGAALDLHLRGRTYYHKYIVEAANKRGIKPLFWTIAGNEFDWTTGAITDADTVRALTGGPALPPPAASTTPNPPSGLTATVASPNQIDLAWTDNSGNEDGFELDRATNSAFTAGLVTTTLSANTTSRSVTGLSAATTYYFRLRATNGSDASAYTSTVNGTTQQIPPPAPPPPSGRGGGGGGAVGPWFLSGLALLCGLRLWSGRRRTNPLEASSIERA